MSEKLISPHFGKPLEPLSEELSKEEQIRLAKERFEKREQELNEAPDLEPDQRLQSVEILRNLVEETQSHRTRLKNYPQDKEALFLYTQSKYKLKKLVDEGGMSLEKAYREYIKGKLEHIKFSLIWDKIQQAETEIRNKSILPEVDASKPTDQKLLKSLAISRGESKEELTFDKEMAKKMIESAKQIWGKDSEEFTNMKKELEEVEEKIKIDTIKDLENKKGKLLKEYHELWEKPEVRKFEVEFQIENLLRQIAQSKEVLEIPYTINLMNEIWQIEKNHPNTTVGGVLVGEPGTGKTTTLRHYLSRLGRNYVYMDLSQEVTRYMLFGTKSIEFTTQIEKINQNLDNLDKMEVNEILLMIQENSETFAEAFPELRDRAIELKESSEEEKKKLKSDLCQRIKKAFRKELAKELVHTQKKNGWRDGFLISALKNNRSPIFDEFNRSKSLPFLFSILTAIPATDKEAGSNPQERFSKNQIVEFQKVQEEISKLQKEIEEISDSDLTREEKQQRIISLEQQKESLLPKMREIKGWWYFADNNEWIRVPKDWRIYFTGNIGKKHEVFSTVSALGSRMEGKIVKVDYPPSNEELLVTELLLADRAGKLHRSFEDLGGLIILIKNIIPKIRTYISDRKEAIPISLRTYHTLAEKLYDSKTLQAKSTSLDRAIYDTMIKSYSITEDTTIPKQITNICTSAGLLLGEDVEDDVLKYIDKEELKERRKAHEEGKKNKEELAKDIAEIHKQALAATFPSRLLLKTE